MLEKNKLSTKVRDINEWDLTLETRLPNKSHDFFITFFISETPFTLITQSNLHAHPNDDIITYFSLMLMTLMLF